MRRRDRFLIIIDRFFYIVIGVGLLFAMVALAIGLFSPSHGGGHGDVDPWDYVCVFLMTLPFAALGVAFLLRGCCWRLQADLSRETKGEETAAPSKTPAPN